MVVFRVSHSNLGRVHYRTRSEAVTVARELKLQQLRDGVRPAHREVPVIEKMYLPPMDARLVVDMLNGKDPAISLVVVNGHRRHRET